MTWFVTGLALWLTTSVVVALVVGRGIALADAHERTDARARRRRQPSHHPAGRPGLTTSRPWITAMRASTGS